MADWQPSARMQTLKLRAQLLAQVRQFFAMRGVLEVETPLLSKHTVSDVNLASFSVSPSSTSDTARSPSVNTGSSLGHSWLQTSPEYAMKRLLAAGSGPIYQICKAFRVEGDEEGSRLHNPEFTMLEWYRPGFKLDDLMNETSELIQQVLRVTEIPRLAYRDVFAQHLQINPHQIENDALQALTRKAIDLGATELDATDCLQLLMNQCIEPHLPACCFIYDYPVAQAALAEIEVNAEGEPVARRFELYAGGMEIANAYQELTDAQEQRRRFEADQRRREQRGLPVNSLDENFLAALEHGLPPCSGIALGLDRLLMAATGEKNISSVLAFDHRNA